MKFPIEQRFKLSDTFIEKYKNIKPNWGFGGLGEFVFLRTYSRLKEFLPKKKSPAPATIRIIFFFM